MVPQTPFEGVQNLPLFQVRGSAQQLGAGFHALRLRQGFGASLTWAMAVTAVSKPSIVRAGKRIIRTRAGIPGRRTSDTRQADSFEAACSLLTSSVRWNIRPHATVNANWESHVFRVLEPS